MKPQDRPTLPRERASSRFVDVGGDVAPIELVEPSYPARASLLWLPAMGVPARKYRPFAEMLAERGIAVALLEWRGTDRSPVRASRGSDWGYRTLILDIEKSRSVLGKLQRGWLIGGHSLGAQLAGLVAAKNPASFDGYVIVGSGQPWWRGFPPAQQPILFGVFAFFRALASAVGYFPGDRVGFAGREAASVVKEWVRSGMTGNYRVDGFDHDFEALLRAYPNRTLAIRGVDDRYVPKGSLDHLLTKLPRSRVTRIELEPSDFLNRKADHFAWMRDPQPVVDAIERWL